MSRSKVAAQLTQAQLDELCDYLAALPKGERSGPKVQELLADKYNIEVGHNAVYTLLNGPFAEHLNRIRARRERIEMLTKARNEAPDLDESFIAEDTAAQLSFILNDYVATKGDTLNPSSTDDEAEEMKRLAILQKLVEQVSTIRKDDRALRAELRSAKKVIEETKDDLKNTTLTEDERAARMRARFGV